MGKCEGMPARTGGYSRLWGGGSERPQGSRAVLETNTARHSERENLRVRWKGALSRG